VNTKDFNYDYPEALVATEPRTQFRILLQTLPQNTSMRSLSEIKKIDLFRLFYPGDVLVINDTKVERRRVLTAAGLEILFLEASPDKLQWQVLFAARDLREGETILLPGDVTAILKTKGLPQTLQLNEPLPADYFLKHGELALPPYIQKARGERRNRPDEEKWYQTEWAAVNGSQAAPTASLHFTNEDLRTLESRGILVLPLTLHVGVGTFLPIKTERLEDHVMHSESVDIPIRTIEQVIKAKREGRKIWALGTTAARALESWALGMLEETFSGSRGATKLFIQPGHKFEVVDCLLTNFHQPESTLLALVSAFAGRDIVLQAYSYAIEKKFRLFSYGDLSVWVKN
jgi:S-adenosylmethionine:tRNA ribosyltransferase-isomerase